MRRKVTINVDETWLEYIDSTRGLIPRSRYIEMIARDVGTAPAKADRSPEPPVDFLVTEDVKQRYDKQLASAGLPAVRKHAPTCSCAVCRPVK